MYIFIIIFISLLYLGYVVDRGEISKPQLLDAV